MATVEPGTTVWVSGMKGVVTSTYKPLGTYREFRIRLDNGQELSRSKLDFELEDPFNLTGMFINIVFYLGFSNNQCLLVGKGGRTKAARG
jgi:hypothetical protein